MKISSTLNTDILWQYYFDSLFDLKFCLRKSSFNVKYIDVTYSQMYWNLTGVAIIKPHMILLNIC